MAISSRIYKIGTVAGLINAGFNLYGAWKTNDVSKAVGAQKDKLDALIVNAPEAMKPQLQEVVNNLDAVRNDAYKLSRTQGIGADIVLLVFYTVPGLVESLDHKAKGAWTTCRYWTDNALSHLGRALQLGGLGLVGKGIHADGQGNPQQATGYVAGGTVALFAGNTIVNGVKAKEAAGQPRDLEQGGRNVAGQQYDAPLMPQQPGGEGSYVAMSGPGMRSGQ
jgi:hypothetical protein